MLSCLAHAHRMRGLNRHPPGSASLREEDHASGISIFTLERERWSSSHSTDFALGLVPMAFLKLAGIAERP
jgi:hypothetical protein